MRLPTLPLLLVQIALLLLVVIVLIVRLQRLRQGVDSSRARHAAWLGAGTEFRVALLSSAELERPEFAMRNAQPGVLVVGANSVRFAGRAPLSQRDLQIDFDVATTRVALFPATWSSVGLRTLLRLSSPAGSHYFFAQRALGQPDDKQTMALHRVLATRVAPEPRSAANETAATPVYAYVATALVALAAIGLSSAIALLRPDTGPWALASHPTHGIVGATQHELLRFDATGALTRHEPIASLGLAHAPGALAFAPDGTLYAGDPDTGVVYKCAERCAPLPTALPDDARPHGALKLALDPTGTRIVLTVAGDYRVLLLDTDGAILDRLDRAASGLCFPNGVAFGADGHAYIADTNQFRIAEFAIDGGKLKFLAAHEVVAPGSARPGSECSEPGTPSAATCGFAQPLPGGRAGHVWPVALAQDGRGHWWVTLANGRLERADIAEFDADFGAPTVRSLGDRADPVAVARWNDAVWISDTNAPGIRVADAKGIEALHDPAFAAFMATIAAAEQRYTMLQLAAPIGALLLLPLILIAAFTGNRRRLAAILKTEPPRA